MKKIWYRILGSLLLLGSVCVIGYPAFSNWLAVQSQDTTIRYYERHVDVLSPEQLTLLWEESRAYNSRIEGLRPADPFDDGAVAADYLAVLNVNGIMGYVDIPVLDVSLPIYHGTGDEVISRGAGHLYGSSLPVGGAGTHAVLTSHSGLSSAKLFTDLERLELDDLFYIRVLDEILAYQVDQILVVEPYEAEALYPEPGADYVTLLTCTPYAINSHRLLVRGARVDHIPEGQAPRPVRVMESTGTGLSLFHIAGIILLGAVSIFVWCKVWKKRTGS